jgi:hypothetical protein
MRCVRGVTVGTYCHVGGRELELVQKRRYTKGCFAASRRRDRHRSG